MTKRECEKALVDLMEQAYRVFKEYDPSGYHLSLWATDLGCCVMGFGGEEGDKGIVLDGFKSASGEYLFSEKEVLA